jgi:hypothetical protein
MADKAFEPEGIAFVVPTDLASDLVQNQQFSYFVRSSRTWGELVPIVAIASSTAAVTVLATKATEGAIAAFVRALVAWRRRASGELMVENQASMTVEVIVDGDVRLRLEVNDDPSTLGDDIQKAIASATPRTSDADGT